MRGDAARRRAHPAILLMSGLRNGGPSCAHALSAREEVALDISGAFGWHQMIVADAVVIGSGTSATLTARDAAIIGAVEMPDPDDLRRRIAIRVLAC